MQDFHQIRIRSGFDGEKFFKPLIPAKNFFKGAGIFPDSLLVINVKRCRIFYYYFSICVFVKGKNFPRIQVTLLRLSV